MQEYEFSLTHALLYRKIRVSENPFSHIFYATLLKAQTKPAFETDVYSRTYQISMMDFLC